MPKEWIDKSNIDKTISDMQEHLGKTRDSLKVLIDKGYIKTFKGDDGEWKYKMTEDPEKLKEAKKWSVQIKKEKESSNER